MSVSGKKTLAGASNVESTSYPPIDITVARSLAAMVTIASIDSTVYGRFPRNE